MMDVKNRKLKGVIIALVVLLVLIVTIVLILVNSKTKKSEIEDDSRKEEFVKILEDGTRLNTSDKLHETKKFSGMEITVFQLTEKNNVCLLLGEVTNTTNEVVGGYPVNIKVEDKNGEEITIIEAYIGELKPGESTEFNTSATFDYVNAYDFSISNK